VIGVIFESRPDALIQISSLCLKSGNAALLRGSSSASATNAALVAVMRAALESVGLPQDAIQLVPGDTHDSVTHLITARGLVDVVIPRGGASLIRNVVDNATVPVIETGVGNCHVYVDAAADLDKAVAIVLNSKTQRLSTCNTAESLLVHAGCAESFLPRIGRALQQAGVDIRGDARTRELVPFAKEATEEDYRTEYLDLIISSKVVDSLEEAVKHINTYGSKHSESIVTENYSHAQYFLDRVDAAAVYVNASTRFTDGFEFGYGAEIGISTQKLHARGPMGLKELTTNKYVIYGSGQIR